MASGSQNNHGHHRSGRGMRKEEERARGLREIQKLSHPEVKRARRKESTGPND